MNTSDNNYPRSLMYWKYEFCQGNYLDDEKEMNNDFHHLRIKVIFLINKLDKHLVVGVVNLQ